jgi:hypothetical protein
MSGDLESVDFYVSFCRWGRPRVNGGLMDQVRYKRTETFVQSAKADFFY